ncbi:MAG: maleylacetoacetate isomerase [Xanthomonadales bacterium]|nr:Maleylpyruvate isomerase [Xanthomonadales bacterium]MCC6592155.1 maleylacetoacetate isomerase [Xanthomonadales bacterium]MCE7931151.1 maleylacetoacetate isomerase [Xanthomonadales bacterium PRO6]
MSDLIRLYSYWRSSAAFRVRIALNLKGLKYDYVAVNLVEGGGQQRQPAFHKLNPQELVPVLIDGERVVRQSMAIMEYLAEVYHGAGYALMPSNARERARVRSISQLVACDIHPLNNTRVLGYLGEQFGASQAQKEIWVRQWIGNGFVALEELLATNPSTGEFCEGDEPTMADCCLVPQVYNARRFGLDMNPFPTIGRIHQRCLSMSQFGEALPENQPDAPGRGR